MLKILYANNIAQTSVSEFDKFAQSADELVFPSSELESDRTKEEKIQWDFIRELPTHLRYRDFIVSTVGKAAFVPQAHLYIPGNSVVQILDAEGEINIGLETKRKSDPTGKLNDGMDPGQTNDEFVMQQATPYSLLIGNSNVIFINDKEKMPCSVGGKGNFWMLTARDGGRCMVAFNNEHDDNLGLFTATLRVWKPKDFKAFYGNMLRT